MIRLQLWRNATLLRTINDKRFLIDPMLSQKGDLGIFPWTKDKRRNPLVDLPFSKDTLRTKLNGVDAVVVSHLHPDHWDEEAICLINKSTSIICPVSLIEQLKFYGFKNIQAIEERLLVSETVIHLTKGKHGRGEIGELMGAVNGFVFSHRNQSIYITGDTIWCEEVNETIIKHQPQHIIVAGGAATFGIGEPVTMTGEDIKILANHSPRSLIWITHLEAISPCKEDRHYLQKFLQGAGLKNQCKVLADGEEINLD